MRRIVLFLLVLVYCNTIYAQKKYDFIICNFFSGNSFNKIVSVKLQSGISVSFDSSRPIILPFDKNNSSNIVFTFTKGDGTQGYGTLYTYTISEAVYSERVVFYTDYSHNPSYPQDFGVVYNHYTKNVSYGSSYFCEEDNLYFDLPDYAGIRLSSFTLQIREKINNGDWIDFISDYDGHSILYKDIDSFCQSHFGKSILDCKCEVRILYAGFEYNLEQLNYYPKVSFNKDNISIEDSTIIIENVNKDENLITFEHQIKHCSYDVKADNYLNNSPSTIQKKLTCGLYSIIIGDQIHEYACPLTYYANIMKATRDTITANNRDYADFWSETQAQKGRDGAIILHSYSKGNLNLCNPIISMDNEQKGTSTTKIYWIDNGGKQYDDLEANDTQYELKGCKRDNTINITYDKSSNYIPQTIHYTLKKCFENITASATQIDPECSDGFGTLKLSDIKEGLNNGYYYTITRDNETISTTAISSADGTMSVKNGDIIRIYDNDYFAADNGREYRKWEYTVNGLSAIQPSFSYPSAHITCFGGSTEQVVEIMLF